MVLQKTQRPIELSMSYKPIFKKRLKRQEAFQLKLAENAEADQNLHRPQAKTRIEHNDTLNFESTKC